MNIKNKYSIKRNQFLMKVLSTSLLAVAMLTGGGCSLINEDLPDCPPIQNDDSDKILLQFNMETGGILSRTRTDDLHGELDSEWNVFEDQIYTRDLGLYIFMGKGDNAPLIAMNTNIANSSDSYEMITGLNGFYTITMTVDRDEIDERLTDTDNSIDLRILILANCYSYGSNGGRFQNLEAHLRNSNTEASTFKEIIDRAELWGFDMNEIYNHNEGDSYVDGLYKGYIPMFGTNYFNISRETLLRSTMGEQIFLGEVSMLRALAKVRVEDNIADKVNGYPRISEVNFQSQTDLAFCLPSNANQYVDGQQIHKDYHINSNSDSDTDGYIFKLGRKSDDNNVRIGYVPEQEMFQALPAFLITVETKPGEEVEYVVPMSGYEDQVFDFNKADDVETIPCILRNHIYTLSVNEVRLGLPVDVTIKVEDWTEETYTLDYTQTETISQSISWSGYADNTSLNMSEGWVISQPWHDGNPVPLVCTFGINDPKGVEWTASLIPIDNPGAFMFLDADGKQVETISGFVDGKTLSTLSIVTVNETPQVQSSAYLQIILLVNGQYKTIDICQNPNYDYFKIIQNPQ